MLHPSFAREHVNDTLAALRMAPIDPVAIIVAKILPAHAPGVRFYEDIKKTNAALDPLKLDSDPRLRVLDLWSDFTNTDGTIRKNLFTPDNIHLSPAGYAVYAERLKPAMEIFLKK